MNAQFIEIPLGNAELLVTGWSKNKWSIHHPVSVKDTPIDFKALALNNAPHSQW